MATAKTDQELACVDGSQQEPKSFTIGTPKAFNNGYAYAYEKNRSAPKQYMFVRRAARGLVQMKYWCCDACMNFLVTKVLAFGLPSMVPSVPTAQLSSAVKPFFAAFKPTLLAKVGTTGRQIRRPIPVRLGVRLIGQANSGQKRGIHDRMLIIHRIEPLLNIHHDEHRIKKSKHAVQLSTENGQYNFAPKSRWRVQL